MRCRSRLVRRLSGAAQPGFLESDNAGLPKSNDEIAELMIFLDHDRVQRLCDRGLQPGTHLVRHAITDAATKLLRCCATSRLSISISIPDCAHVTGDSVLSLSQPAA